MSEDSLSSDAMQWAYDRFIKGKPERETSLAEVSRQSGLAEQIYDIREKLRMTREDLAQASGLTSETIEDLEESDYEGDWDEAIEKVNAGFHYWFTNVVLPVSRMKREEYSVGVNA
jgi:DNA-binding XRE family transcriptional regulator